MSDPNKHYQKEAVAARRASHQSTARATLPLPDEQMQAMFNMLDDVLTRQGCDHSLRLTTGWLAAEGLSAEPVIEWLRANGGYCDCEALANSEETWLAAVGRL